LIGDDLQKEIQAQQLMPIHQLGRYEIIGELGRGAMGIVYKAQDPLIERVVAVKCVGIGMSQEETEAFDQRFYREAKSAGRLNHPNIVTIHDVGKSGDHAYIAMEFLEGQSLREILDSGVVLPLDLISDVIAQVADGLAFAHQNAIVHRDIKPANIMVLYNGAVKITDFGIALLPTGSRTMAGTIFGSPKYISPEQVVGNQVDGRSDIFSLGSVLYETLTGAPPFTGDELNAILYKVINEMPLPPSSRNRRIPSAFDYIVMKAMAKLPGERYQTVQEMAADIRNYLQLTPPAATTALATQTLERRSVRRPQAEVVVQPVVTVVATPRSAVPSKPHRTLDGRTSRNSQGDATVRINAAANDAMPLDSQAKTPSNTGLGRRSKLIIVVSMILLTIFAAWVSFQWRGTKDKQAPSRAGDPTSISPELSGNKKEGTATSGKGGESQSAPSSVTAIEAKPENALVANPAPIQATPQSQEGVTRELSNETAVTPSAPVDPKEKASKKKNPGTATTGLQVGTSKIKPSKSALSGDKMQTAVKATATVVFAVSPWGEIYINGQREGISPPLKELNLPPGKHIIEIRNSAFPPHRETIDLTPESSVKVKHKFQ
jgi:eukaryotic-like serine/threonine-protein kinase